MRLDRLSIPNYRNLRAFEIEFAAGTTVLLGQNAAGKSNLLEALVAIFLGLERGECTDFAYDLSYHCSGHAIHVSSERLKKLRIKVDGKQISTNRFKKHVHAYLPLHLFGYYSGSNGRLEKQFNTPTRTRARELVKGGTDAPRRAQPTGAEDLRLRRFFFCRHSYGPLALLAFFLSEEQSAKTTIFEHLQIEGLESALFVLERPSWAPRQSADEDQRFWGVSGVFSSFLERLWGQALAPICSTEDVEQSLPHDKRRTERRYLFVRSEESLHALREPFESAKSLFGSLESLFLADLLREVRVTVRRRDGVRVAFAQLSEGEQQLLTVLGLIHFTQDDESLYLLDEPDTHLNPLWTYGFVGLLHKAIQTNTGHMIVSTHNPLMLGGLRKEEVRVLATVDSKTIAHEPDFDPIGVGVEGLLKSELFGLRSTLAPEVMERIDKHYWLLGKSERSVEEQQELMRLSNELNELGIARSHPNPYFEQFASALARRSPRADIALTKESLEAQARLADDVLSEVIAEEEGLDTGKAS